MGIFGMWGREKDRMIGIEIGYRGGGLGIGCVIIELIVGREWLRLWGGRDWGCDKEFFGGDILGNRG